MFNEGPLAVPGRRRERDTRLVVAHLGRRMRHSVDLEQSDGLGSSVLFEVSDT
jgi:hypothetical protein